MKKISIILFAIMSMSISSCKQNASNRVNDENLTNAQERDRKKVKDLAKMTFVSKEFNFGTIKQGDKIDAVFEFTNTGESDLIITKAKSSCGCTVPEWPKDKPIKPGEKGKIKAVYDSKGKQNNQNKSITLTTNTLSGREVIYVKGFVTPSPGSKKAEPIFKPVIK